MSIKTEWESQAVAMEMINAGLMAYNKHKKDGAIEMVGKIIIAAKEAEKRYKPPSNLIEIDRALLLRILTNNPQPEFEFLFKELEASK